MSESRSPRRRPEQKIRRAEPARSRGRWRLLLAVVSISLVALGAFLILRSPWLSAQQVSVQGAATLDEAFLIEISGLQGASMLSLPIDAARGRLLELPQVRSVSISRDWPRGVTIRVEEREPAAFWSVGGRDYVVDADGFVLAAGAPSGPAPRIVEPDSNRVMGPGDRVHPDAVALAARIFKESPRVLGQSVDRLEYAGGIGVTAVFGNGTRVTFGDERAYDYKVAVLSKLLDQLQARAIKPRAVDLRFGERVTYE